MRSRSPTRRRGTARAAAALTVLLPAWLAGCGDPDEGPPRSPEPASSVRDSAGVEIIEGLRPAWEGEEAWTVADSPRVTIGEAEGAEEYLLDRVTGAVLLSDGRIVVANSGSAQIRIYDPEGRHLQTLGGRGEGPGELRRPTHLLRDRGDTIVVWEPGVGPTSVFTPEGEFVRRYQIDRERLMSLITWERATERITPLPDGSIVVHVTTRGWGGAPTTPEGEVVRPPLGFYRLPADLSRVDSLGWYGGLPQMYLEIGDRRHWMVVHAPSHATVTGGGDPLRIYAGNGEEWQVDVYDGAGRLERILRPSLDPRPLTEEMRRQWESRTAQSSPDARRVLARMPPTEHLPAYREMRVDSEGHLWVGHYGAGLWEIFGPEGEWLGSVEAPPGLQEIGPDYVIALQRGPLGIEQVAVYDLERDR